jgi:3-oxoacyl-[acyl-carrier-protein] synthase-3
MARANILSVAGYLPGEVRTNDWFRERAPDVVATAEKHALANVFAPTGTDPSTRLFDECAAPYMNDPFRGTVARRAMRPDEDVRGIESTALQRALDAASLTPKDLDLLICVSFRPEEVSPGNAAYIAKDLGTDAAVMNIEATCSGTLMAMQTAASLIESECYRTVAVVTSCTYSRDLDLQDSLSWFLGDAAGCIVMASGNENTGILASTVVSTTETCGAFRFHPCGSHEFRIGVGEVNGGPMMRAMSARDLRVTAESVAEQAGFELADIDYLIINTPTAWMANLGVRALDLQPSQTNCSYAEVANVGPALTTINMWQALRDGRIKSGDLVLIHGFGTVSNAGAILVRWGDTACA